GPADLPALLQRAQAPLAVLCLLRPPAPPQADPGAAGRPADHDRLAMVVPAPRDGREGAGILPPAPRRDPLLPHHLDSGRDLLSDLLVPSGPARAEPLAHSVLPAVHRFRHAGHLPRRPFRHAAGAGLPVRAQDEPRGRGAEAAAGAAVV